MRRYLERHGVWPRKLPVRHVVSGLDKLRHDAPAAAVDVQHRVRLAVSDQHARRTDL